MITKGINKKIYEVAVSGKTLYYPDKCTFQVKEYNYKEDHNANKAISIGWNNLYETKGQAEHALNYTRIPKTEYLDLPYWDEILEQSKQKGEMIIKFNNFSIATDYSEKDVSMIALVKKDKNDFILLFSELLTKENYNKACEIAKKLWLGE